MKPIDKLTVRLNENVIGTLAMTPEGLCAFEYTPQWIAGGFSISPLELPLKPGLFIAKNRYFDGDFAIFDDSLPDGYGRLLIHKILKKHGIDSDSLSPLTWLSIIGKAGMGALNYLPTTRFQNEKDNLTLDELQNFALEVLSEKTDAHEELLYSRSGNSGGCRPKILMQKDGTSWLVKFRSLEDSVDAGRTEFLYNIVAGKCGITIPKVKLFENNYFGVERFDTENGNRLHVATASALLSMPLSNATVDYSDLLKLTGFLTQDPMQVEEMFRRMVFNILADNKDDHAKNTSFICRGGRWTLSPVYDLTRFKRGYNGEHACSVNGNGMPRLSDILKVGEDIRITRKRCMEIIREVYSACGEILSEDYKGII